ncbi:Mic10p [Sporobolomyces salmoneus]|uniref:Mic10p n=1 Tax=Sporobolomyces salmoneus TaxID=183962 RepID=UPI0031704554
MSTASKSETPASIRSEDVLSAKTDLCLSNGIVTAGTGIAVGIVASAILFKRRPWPVFFGLGWGLGQGYSDCQRVFNPAAIPGYRIQGEEGKPASPFTLNRSTSSAPAAAEASRKFDQTKEETKSKVSDLVQQAKVKASQAASVVEEKATEVKDKVVKGEKKVEAKVDDLKDGKKWV